MVLKMSLVGHSDELYVTQAHAGEQNIISVY